LVGLQNAFYPSESCCLRVGGFVRVLYLEGTAGQHVLPRDRVRIGVLHSVELAQQSRIEIRRSTGSSRASVQVLANYYVPWSHTTVGGDLHQDAKVSDPLRLAVRFDKQSANVGENIECTVDAERIGFRGYGMLLAEIGLPPGAEVDRNSLEKAMKASGWDINEYDVLPDRLIVYLWPHAGGTKFLFGFKPRFGLKALSAPSILYDYYNPESHAIVEPMQFTVQ